MASLKSLGPNGFHAGFYQKSQEVVGSSVYKQVLNFFEYGQLEEGMMNDTLVTLISKVQNLNSMSQFRPISLYNVMYKVIMKAMTNRIKPILKDLIGPVQSSFVPGRQIVDSILIYLEILHTMHNSQNGKKFMVLKIDMEKAYDRLDQNFIKATFDDMGLRLDWTRNIMTCVTTIKLGIIWNGSNWIGLTQLGALGRVIIFPHIFLSCVGSNSIS